MLRRRTLLGVVSLLFGVALLVGSYWSPTVPGLALGAGAVAGLAGGTLLVGTATLESSDARAA